MFVTCQRFGDLSLLGLVWKYSSVQTKYIKGRFKVMRLLTCSRNINLSLSSYTGSALKRELNFRNYYISLLYFWSIATFDSIGFYKLVHCAVHRHCGSFDTGTTPKNGIPLTNSNIISQKNILFLCGIVTVMLLLVEHY